MLDELSCGHKCDGTAYITYEAVYREFIIYGTDAGTQIGLFDVAGPSGIFLLKYGVPEVPEVSRSLPGARGFVFPKYQPMAIHGDPIHPRKYLMFSNLHVPDHMFGTIGQRFFDFVVPTLMGGVDPSKKMRTEI